MFKYHRFTLQMDVLGQGINTTLCSVAMFRDSGHFKRA